MKKNIFALSFFIFFALLLSGPANAYQSWIERECPQETDVNIVFTSSYGKLSYKYKPSSVLKTMTKHKKSTEKVLGLTVPNPTMKVSLETSIIENSLSDDVCIIPETVEVFFGFVNPVIYVARESKDKKCERTLVLRHEQTHQQINLLALDYFLPQMKRLMRKKANELKPVVSTKQQAKALIDDMNLQLMNRMTDLYNQFNNFIEQEQGKLDNKENYAFESSVCGS